LRVDPNIKFSRARRGYDPQEADVVFEKMQREIDDLQQEKQLLNYTIQQYDEKIRMLDESMKQLEEERCKGNWRLSGMVNVDAMPETLEQNAAATLEQARREAMELLDKAREESNKMLKQSHLDCAAARGMLAQWGTTMQTFQYDMNQCILGMAKHLSELSALREKALKGIPGTVPTQPSSIPSFPDGAAVRGSIFPE